jgi:hypothetical protein
MPFKLIVYWLFVAVPLGWGVTQSVKKAMPLFSSEAPAANTPTAGSVR